LVHFILAFTGVLVTEIAPESVASKILVKGDIIRKFNGETITTLHDLSISLFETTLDQNSLTLIRDSEEMIVQVNL
jgi:S1-C subfamily serine protease